MINPQKPGRQLRSAAAIAETQRSGQRYPEDGRRNAVGNGACQQSQLSDLSWTLTMSVNS
jgi:hypothetical protein